MKRNPFCIDLTLCKGKIIDQNSETLKNSRIERAFKIVHAFSLSMEMNRPLTDINARPTVSQTTAFVKRIPH